MTILEDPVGSRQRSESSLLGILDRYLDAPGLALPICRESAALLLEELDSAETQQARLRMAALSDPALLAALLREANGPSFEGLSPVCAVEAALTRLGDDRSEELLMTLLTGSVLTSEDSVLTDSLRYTWKRSRVIARTASAIAERSGHAEHTAQISLLGLLSEVGVLFLIAALHAHRAQQPGHPSLTDAAKREVMGQLHSAYGVRLLERWRFPPVLLEVLAGQPTLAAADAQFRTLRMAQFVVASVGLGSCGADPSSNPDHELWTLAEFLDLGNVAVASLQVQAEDFIEELSLPGSEQKPSVPS